MKAGTDSTGIICLYYLITGREKTLVEYIAQESILNTQLLLVQKGNIQSM